MALFKVLRGNKANLNSQPITDGYAWFIKDTGEFFIDVGTNRVQLNAKYAAGLKSDSTTIEISDVVTKQALAAYRTASEQDEIDSAKIDNPSTKEAGQCLKYNGTAWVADKVDVEWEDFDSGNIQADDVLVVNATYQQTQSGSELSI